MSQKVKDIIFYILAGLTIASAIACMVCEAVFGPKLPTWASVLLCVGTFLLAMLGTFLTSKSVDKIKANKKLEEQEIHNVDDTGR